MNNPILITITNYCHLIQFLNPILNPILDNIEDFKLICDVYNVCTYNFVTNHTSNLKLNLIKNFSDYSTVHVH